MITILYYYLIISLISFLAFNLSFFIDILDPRDTLRLAIIQSYQQGWRFLVALFFLIALVLVIFSLLWPLLVLALIINIFKPSFIQTFVEKVMNTIHREEI
jgi:hypothetical protein